MNPFADSTTLAKIYGDDTASLAVYMAGKDILLPATEVVGVASGAKFVFNKTSGTFVKIADNMANPPAKPLGWNQKGMVDVGEPKPTGNATVDSMGLDKPYNPTEIRTSLENTYGKDKVISSTTPTDPPMRVNSNPDKGINVVYNDSGKVGAVRVEYKDPLTGEAKVANIPYDQRQLPVMDDVSKYTTSIDTSLGYKAQMREATRDLRQAIQNGKVDASLFTSEQLKAIDAGLEKIPGYTWHHNAQAGPNNFQLIPTKVHQGALHIGQGALSKGK